MNGNIDNKNCNSEYGYTLIELLVVIALFAIVLSIGIPSTKIIFNTREKKELMGFKRDIIFARNSAVVENCNYILYVYVDKNRYKIAKENGLIVTIIKDIKFCNGIIIKGNNFNSIMKFHPNGTPNNAGRILLTNSKKENIEITITPATGKVNLYINSK